MSNYRDEITRLACASVKPATQEHYCSLLRKIMKERPPEEDRTLYPSMDGFLCFLTLPAAQNLSHAYVTHLKAAVVWNHEVNEDPLSDSDKAFMTRIVEGFKRTHPETTMPRGAIDAPMLQDLLGMLRSEDYKRRRIVDGLLVQWAFGLRGGQIKGLLTQHFFHVPGEDGEPSSWLYIGPRFKDRTSVSAAVDPVLHRSATQLYDTVSAILRGARPGDMLFPRHDAAEVNRIIQRAAVTLRWDPTLKWDGGHCLRHGSLVEAAREGGLAAVLARGAHRSQQMQLHYSRSNEERKSGVPLADAAAAPTRTRAPAPKRSSRPAAARKQRAKRSAKAAKTKPTGKRRSSA